MLSCCFLPFQGSRLRKAQKECHLSCSRFCHNFNLRRFWPFGRRHPQGSTPAFTEEPSDGCSYANSRYNVEIEEGTITGWWSESSTEDINEKWAHRSTEDILEELALGSHHSICLVKVQVHQVSNTIQCWSESSTWDTIKELVKGFHFSASLGKRKSEAELNVRLTEACRTRALQEGTLEEAAESMVQAFLGGNISCTSTFSLIHPAFSIAQQALDQLFPRYDAIKVFSTPGGIFHTNDQGDTPQDQVKKAIATVVGSWPDQVQGCGQPLHFALAKLQRAFVQVNFPAPHLVGHVHLLWVELEPLQPTEADWKSYRTLQSQRTGHLWDSSQVQLR